MASTAEQIRRLGFEIHRPLGSSDRKGHVVLSYVATRAADDPVLNKLTEIDDEGKLAELFGEDSVADPRSIMPFGARKMADNSAGRSFFVYGFDADDADGHSAARDAVELEHGDNIPPIAIVAPQTDSKSLLDPWEVLGTRATCK